MSSAEEHTQRVGQLIERLLLDAPFRAEFRKDPAGACQELGLADLAEEIGRSGSAMHTLELRESKSSLAGVVMAVAAEGIGVVELHGLVEHGLLKGNLRAAGEQALRGVNPMHPASSLHSELRGENPLRGAAHNPLGAAERSAQLARGAEQSAGGTSGSAASAGATPGGASSAPAPGGAAAGTAAPGGTPGSAAAGTAAPGGAASATSAAGAPAPGASAAGASVAPGSSGGAAGAADAASETPSGAPGAATPVPTPGTGGAAQAGVPTPGTGGGAAQAGTPTPGTGGAAQAGMPTPGSGGTTAQAGTLTPSPPEAQPVGGGGGVQAPPTPPVPGAQPAAGGAVAVWPEPSQAPGGAGAADVAPIADLSGQGAAAGAGSPGLAELLDSPHLALPPDVRAVFAQGNIDPRIVSVLDDAVAHHNIVIGDIETSTEPVHAQAIDIISVDGQPVGPSNVGARDLITEIAAMEPGARPNEIGTPWPIQAQGFFTDAQHQNRLHLAFTSTAEFDPQAPGGSAYPAGTGVAAGTDAAAGTSAAAGAPGTVADVGTAPATPGATSPSTPGAPSTGGGVAEQSAAVGAPAASPSGSTAYAAQDAVGGGGASGHASAAAAEAAAAMNDPNWASAKAHAAYEVAKSELGVPYLWGGTSPKTGFDCSGLMQYAYGRVGIHIPRVAAEQFQVGTPVGLHQLREGDLVFFKESDGYIHHVGMYVGDGRFIQAPQTGQDVDYGNLREPYFAQQFAGGRRIVPLSPPPAMASGSATDQAAPGAVAGTPSAAPAAGGSTPPAGAPTPPASTPPAVEVTPGAASGAAAPAAAGAAASAAPAAAPGVQLAAGPLPPEPPPQPGTAVFKALQAQEASYLRHTVKFLQAVPPPPSASPPADGAAGVSAAAQAPSEQAAAASQAAGQSPAVGTGAVPGEAVAGTSPGVAGQTPASANASDQVVGGEPAHTGGAEAAGALDAASSGTIPYPGDNAPKAEIAQWMGDIAQKHGLPRELPVMAALVESSLHNDPGGDRDSVGYFQMRTGIWDNGPYAGYPSNPSLQLKWFIDQAVAVKSQMPGRGFGSDSAHYGEWIDEIERPAEEYRGRYQLQLEAARSLLSG